MLKHRAHAASQVIKYIYGLTPIKYNEKVHSVGVEDKKNTLRCQSLSK